MLGLLVGLVALCGWREGAIYQLGPEEGLVALVEDVSIFENTPSINADQTGSVCIEMLLRNDTKVWRETNRLSGADINYAQLLVRRDWGKVRFTWGFLSHSRKRSNRDIASWSLAPVVADYVHAEVLSARELGRVDGGNSEVSAQLAAGRFPGLRESQGDKNRTKKAQENSGPSGIGDITGRIDGAPLSAKMASSFILAVWAAIVLFRTYLADSISNLRRATLYCASLTLFALSFGLWMLSAPQ